MEATAAGQPPAENTHLLELRVDDGDSGSSSDDEDSDYDVSYDPAFLEDKELGFHVT